MTVVTSMSLLYMVVHRDNKKEVKKPRKTFPLCRVVQIIPTNIVCKEKSLQKAVSTNIMNKEHTQNRTKT